MPTDGLTMDAMLSRLQGDIRLHFAARALTAFFPFLQRGFAIVITPCSIMDVLCKTCELDPEAIRNRIQTLFLNGKPVDDMTAACVQNGDHLALSAAMPGLVGATMRSGGALAGFRHSISHRSRTVQADSRQGVLTIKLFNLLIRELGPRFLSQGIWATGDDLNILMASLSAQDRGDCRQATLNGRPMDIHALVAKDWTSDKGGYGLQVTFE